MGKKKSKPKGIIKPWYTRYGEVHLYDLARGLIPKRVRNVLSALDRLGNRSLGGAAATDWRHIEKNLAEIEDALSTFETALVQGEDIKRWKDFPGLDGAVKQVKGIVKLLDEQVKKTPWFSFSFELPSFVNDRSLGNTTAVKSDSFATGANGEPLQKPSKDKVKVKVKIEDDDIEEGEIVIKNEDEDEQGVAFDSESPEHLPSPESVDHHNSQARPQQFGYPYATGFCDRFPRLPAHLMAQPPFPQPLFPRDYSRGVVNHHWHTGYPNFYPIIPQHNSGPPSFLSGGTLERAHSQFPYGANHPYLPFDEVPRHFDTPVPAPPGVSLDAFLPAPSFPPPTTSSVAPTSPIQSSHPSPTPDPGRAPPPRPLSPEAFRQQRTSKRKLSESLDSSSGNSRPLKRHLSASIGKSLGADDGQHNQTDSPRSASGPPDFGAWFQDQVADSRKKLSQLERASKPTGGSAGGETREILDPKWASPATPET